MKLLGYNLNIALIVVLILVGIAGIASRFLLKKTDNVIEETAEKIIKDNTGYDVDLSPDTPENK